jgi:hypothetical protein
MRRSFLKQALVVLASCALFLPIAVDYGVPAQAATFTFSDSNCTQLTLSGDAQNGYTLNCQTAGPQVFSCNPISATPSSPTVSQGVTLTATCLNGAGAITYTWSVAGGNPAGCPNTITPEANPSKADLGAPGGQASVGPCTYNLSAFDTVTTLTPSKAVSYTFSGGGGGGGGPLNCSGVSNSSNGSTTITGPTVTIDIPWPADNILHQYITSQSGEFTPDGAVVFRFTTSGVANSSGNSGVIKGVEYQSAPAGRTGALSTQPCDFLGASAIQKSGAGCGKTKFANNSAPSIGLTQGNTTAQCAVALQPSTTYYFSISNTSNNCNGPSCGMIFYFQKPDGT